MEEKYFKLLLKLSHKAAIHNEVPVSALIVKDGKILAKAYNTKVKSKRTCAHAEMLVIKKANRKLHSYYLSNCDLYVTLKPCPMCEAAIKQARISNVFYLTEKLDFKKEYNKTIFTKANIRTLEEDYTKQLKDFFANIRDKN